MNELQIERGFAPELKGEDEMTVAGGIEDGRLPENGGERKKARH
jgi:hypothetical protein